MRSSQSTTLPFLISSYRKLSIESKEALIHLCSKFPDSMKDNQKFYKKISFALEFASTLSKFPSIDAEIHWMGLFLRLRE